MVGYPEWFAQLALGHNSKAVHRADQSVEEENVVRAIRGCDFTRKPSTSWERNEMKVSGC